MERLWRVAGSGVVLVALIPAPWWLGSGGNSWEVLVWSSGVRLLAAFTHPLVG